MKCLQAILFLLLFLLTNNHLVAQTKKEEKIALIINIAVQTEMGNMDNANGEFGFRVEPTVKMKPVHWYGQISSIAGSYTTDERDTTISWAMTGGISIHPEGSLFIGFGAGPYLLTDQGRKRFFWGFTPHIGFETYRLKVSFGATILQKRKNGVDVLSLTVGVKFPDDD